MPSVGCKTASERLGLLLAIAAVGAVPAVAEGGRGLSSGDHVVEIGFSPFEAPLFYEESLTRSIRQPLLQELGDAEIKHAISVRYVYYFRSYLGILAWGAREEYYSEGRFINPSNYQTDTTKLRGFGGGLKLVPFSRHVVRPYCVVSMGVWEIESIDTERWGDVTYSESGENSVPGGSFGLGGELAATEHLLIAVEWQLQGALSEIQWQRVTVNVGCKW